MLEQITNDLHLAMKEHDTLKLNTLRMLKGAIDLERINKKLDSVSDEDVIVIISKQIKTRKESIIEFEKGNRADLINETNLEIDILKKYLPEMLSEDEVNKVIDEVISSLNASSIKDMGNVIKECSSRLKGRADMSVVSSLVKGKLS